MPLVQHSRLPTFERLRDGGHEVLTLERATHQDIRELHIGFLNMMPDAALAAMRKAGLEPAGDDGSYFQVFSAQGEDGAQKHIRNVVGVMLRVIPNARMICLFRSITTA